MVDSKSKSVQLMPDRYPQDDLFICDVADAVLKDFMQEMEHPFYALSKKPDTNIRRYEHEGNWLEVTPSVKGLATIYDKDILIYAISQLIAKLNRGEEVSQRVRINAHEFLIFTNRGTAGKDYKALCDALDRLGGTRISTNIRTGDEEQFDTFGLVDSASVRRRRGLDGRLLWVSVKLSDWVFNAVQAREVLTLNRDYFRLRRPLERRVYEIARKYCGRSRQWRVGLDLLHKKTGSQSPVKKFRLIVKALAEHDHLPDYSVVFDDEKDQVEFRNRKAWWTQESSVKERPHFRDTRTYEDAKRYVPGYASVYEWESDWVNYWIETGCPVLNDPDRAFIGFCKTRYVKLKQQLTH